MTVSVSTSGTPRPLGAATDQAAYRILQEALTNSARHGAGPARVELSFGGQALELAITNPLAADRDSGRNGGHGVVGMRERATLLGGSLSAASSPGRAFEVRAELPYGETR
jgi:signal transduction histidine kinase